MTWKGKLRKNLVTSKWITQRGYQWCTLPMMGSVAAGVLYPYIVQYWPKSWFQLHMWQLMITAFVIMFLVGWIDRKLGVINEEQIFITKFNPILMKIEKIAKDIEEIKNNKIKEGKNEGVNYHTYRSERQRTNIEN